MITCWYNADHCHLTHMKRNPSPFTPCVVVSYITFHRFTLQEEKSTLASLDNDQLDAHLLYFTISPLQSSTYFISCFQLNALVYYLSLYSSTCFEPYCAHHQEVPLYIHSIWFFMYHSSWVTVQCTDC